MTVTSKNLIQAVQRLREIKDILKPLHREEKTLTSTIKDVFESGIHQVGGIAFSITERETVSYDAKAVKDEFPRKVKKMFDAGVFKVDNKKFEEWAASEGWDISSLKEFSYTKVLNI
jgi:predicted phage-related endonuclease